MEYDLSKLDDKTKALLIKFTKSNYMIMFDRIINYLEGEYELTEYDMINLQNLHSDLTDIITCLEQ